MFCKDCKHWGVSPAGYVTDGNDKPCELTDSSYGKPFFKNSKAVVSSYEEGSLITAPDFGCVQFEAK